MINSILKDYRHFKKIEGKFFFWDPDHQTFIGPFDDRKKAEQGCKDYDEWLEEGKNDNFFSKVIGKKS